MHACLLKLEEIAEDIRKEFVPVERSFPPWLQVTNYNIISPVIIKLYSTDIWLWM